MSQIDPEQINRVIVRGANWVGDSVMTVPALRALRLLLPRASITLATRPWNKGLFEDADFLDELVANEGTNVRSLLHQVARWRRGRFDLALIFPNSFEAALVSAVARVPLRVGYDKEARGRLLTHPVPLPEWQNARHQVFYYLNLIAEVELLVFGTEEVLKRAANISLPVRQARKQKAAEFLRQQGRRNDGPLIALCPGSTNSRAKRWPTERYAEVADSLIDLLGANVLLIGSSQELDVSLETSRRMRNVPTILTGKTELEQSVAILSVVDLLVTNDTGPAHIAAAVGTPTLVIFGPTNPLTTRPFASTAELVQRSPECAPCMLRDCPIDHRCMTAIGSMEVFNKACAMLDRYKAQKLEVGAPPPTANNGSHNELLAAESLTLTTDN